MMDKAALDALYGQWVHSNEEDTADEMVFRSSDYKFPPSRGRQAFELKSDNSFIGAGIGPTDVSRVSQGRWMLQTDDGLKVLVDVGGAQEILEITSIDKGRLSIRKK